MIFDKKKREEIDGLFEMNEVYPCYLEALELLKDIYEEKADVEIKKGYNTLTATGKHGSYSYFECSTFIRITGSYQFNEEIINFHYSPFYRVTYVDKSKVMVGTTLEESRLTDATVMKEIKKKMRRLYFSVHKRNKNRRKNNKKTKTTVEQLRVNATRNLLKKDR